MHWNNQLTIFIFTNSFLTQFKIFNFNFTVAFLILLIQNVINSKLITLHTKYIQNYVQNKLIQNVIKHFQILGVLVRLHRFGSCQARFFGKWNSARENNWTSWKQRGARQRTSGRPSCLCRSSRLCRPSSLCRPSYRLPRKNHWEPRKLCRARFCSSCPCCSSVPGRPCLRRCPSHHQLRTRNYIALWIPPRPLLNQPG